MIPKLIVIFVLIFVILSIFIVFKIIKRDIDEGKSLQKNHQQKYLGWNIFTLNTVIYVLGIFIPMIFFNKYLPERGHWDIRTFWSILYIVCLLSLLTYIRKKYMK